jgi:hypothetical protein
VTGARTVAGERPVLRLYLSVIDLLERPEELEDCARGGQPPLPHVHQRDLGLWIEREG